MFMCMGVLPACVFVHHVCTVLTKAKRGQQIPGTGVTGEFVLSRAGWELNRCCLGEQPVFLTTHLVLQPQFN